jgi:hypothetical protein
MTRSEEQTWDTAFFKFISWVVGSISAQASVSVRAKPHRILVSLDNCYSVAHRLQEICYQCFPLDLSGRSRAVLCLPVAVRGMRVLKAFGSPKGKMTR